MSQYQTFTGTAKQFLAANVRINGKDINQPGISMMAQYGVIKIVGEEPRPEGKRGHAEKIYQIVGKSGLKVEFDPEFKANNETHEAVKSLQKVLG